MSVVIEKAKIEDLVAVYKQSDIKKTLANMATVRRIFHMSHETWAGRINGRLVCVYGLRRPSVICAEGYLWLLTVEKIEDTFLFIRHSQIVVKEMLKDCPVILGHVVAESEVSKRWLKFLGFDILPGTAPMLEIVRRA